MQEGYIEDIAILQYSDGKFYNHYNYDEETGTGTAETGPFNSLNDAKAVIRQTREDKKDPNAVLVCVGTGELEDKIKEKCKMLQIDDRVKFLGFRSDVNRIMQAFDLLVMPSHFEGLPVTGVEAQAIGVPVLFATTITKDAAILPQSAYLNLSDSPEVWAEKILEYKNMQRENDPHKWIEQKGYDIKKETKKLDDFYLEKSSMI
nr:glycosyltransferase [Faecalibacterium sp. Marseille-P9590]